MLTHLKITERNNPQRNLEKEGGISSSWERKTHVEYTESTALHLTPKLLTVENFFAVGA